MRWNPFASGLLFRDELLQGADDDRRELIPGEFAGALPDRHLFIAR